MQLFEVTGMTCGHCVRTVAEAVKSVDPAADVRVDLDAKRVHVDSEADPGALTAAIEAVGYPAHPATA